MVRMSGAPVPWWCPDTADRDRMNTAAVRRRSQRLRCTPSPPVARPFSDCGLQVRRGESRRPAPGDGVTIFGNARITPPPSRCPDASRCPDGGRSGASPGPMRSTCAQDRPPPSGTPGVWSPAPPLWPAPRHGAWMTSLPCARFPPTEYPPRDPGPLGPQGPPGTGDPRFGTRQGSQAFTPCA